MAITPAITSLLTDPNQTQDNSSYMPSSPDPYIGNKPPEAVAAPAPGYPNDTGGTGTTIPDITGATPPGQTTGYEGYGSTQGQNISGATSGVLSNPDVTSTLSPSDVYKQTDMTYSTLSPESKVSTQLESLLNAGSPISHI